MLYSQSPPLTAEATSAEATSSGWLARDPGARSDHPYRFGEGQLASGRPSIGRRIFRTLTRFSIAVLIGVGATLGWQSYGGSQGSDAGLGVIRFDDDVARRGCNFH